MKQIILYLMLTSIISFVGCSRNEANSAEPNLPDLISEHLTDLDGIWVSDGYGYVIEQTGDKFGFYHATEEVCVAVDVSDISLGDVFDLYRFSKSGDTVFLSTLTEPSEIAFHHVEKIPSICTETIPSTAADTIRALVSFMKTHYAFFEARGVNWDTASRRLLSSIDNINSDADLYEAISRELTPLKDAHVELTAYMDDETVKFDADPGVIRETLSKLATANNVSYKEQRTEYNQELWIKGVGEVILGGQGHSAGNDRIRFGMASDLIGYIIIKSMGGFIESAGEELTETQTLNLALDRAINLFNAEGARTVIVDLSINTGGYDYISRLLTERFVTQPTPAYSFYAADSQAKQRSSFTIKPSSHPRYDGKTIVLSSRASVSAAELALMCFDAIDAVQIVGEASRGALSTKLAKLLPNGWELTLSNQVYLDHDDAIIEVVGVTPDIEIDVFTDDNLAANHLSAVKQVISLAQSELSN